MPLCCVPTPIASVQCPCWSHSCAITLVQKQLLHIVFMMRQFKGKLVSYLHFSSRSSWRMLSEMLWPIRNTLGVRQSPPLMLSMLSRDRAEHSTDLEDKPWKLKTTPGDFYHHHSTALDYARLLLISSKCLQGIGPNIKYLELGYCIANIRSSRNSVAWDRADLVVTLIAANSCWVHPMRCRVAIELCLRNSRVHAKQTDQVLFEAIFGWMMSGSVNMSTQDIGIIFNVHTHLPRGQDLHLQCQVS